MGVTVQLRTGKVVRYAGATEFEAHRGGYWIVILRIEERWTKDKYASTGRRLETKRKSLALIPRSEILRVELSGSGKPTPAGKVEVKR